MFMATMDSEGFQSLIKVMERTKLGFFQKDGTAGFIDPARIYMIIDKEPDYITPEYMKKMETMDLISPRPFGEVRLDIPTFHHIRLGTMQIGKYNRKHWMDLFFIYQKKQHVYIGNLNEHNDETIVETAGSDDKADSDNFIVLFLQEFIANAITFVNTFEKMGAYLGSTHIYFKEDMPILIENDRFKVYLAPRQVEEPEKKRFMYQIENKIKTANNLNLFETDE